MIKTLIVSTALALLPALALATDTPAKTKAPAKAKTSAKASKAPSKTVVAKAEPKTSKASKASATAVAAAALSATPAEPPATDVLELAKRVYVGEMACELGASVRVAADAAQPGHFQLEGKGFKYHMAPVATSTGAVRLEDTKAGAVWLQIGNKSMLMDQKRGQRLADECKGPEQVAVAEALKKAPPQNLLETPPSK